jgi:hypothetical protein
LLWQIARNVLVAHLYMLAYTGVLPAAGVRNGIAAESPQELHKQFRGLGAESPVFCPWIFTGKKCARNY